MTSKQHKQAILRKAFMAACDVGLITKDQRPQTLDQWLAELDRIHPRKPNTSVRDAKIRRARAAGYTYRKIAIRFGLNQARIYSIVNGT